MRLEFYFNLDKHENDDGKKLNENTCKVWGDG